MNAPVLLALIAPWVVAKVASDHAAIQKETAFTLAALWTMTVFPFIALGIDAVFGVKIKP